jgi:hypothetical protein
MCSPQTHNMVYPQRQQLLVRYSRQLTRTNVLNSIMSYFMVLCKLIGGYYQNNYDYGE